MKKSLLESIVCPFCQNAFELKIFKSDANEIEEGSLFCSCGQSFPIIKKIPRILAGDLRANIYGKFPEFFSKYPEFVLIKGTAGEVKGETLEKERVLKSFGYEWDKFSQMRKEWEKNFNFYFEPIGDLSTLKGKKALEASCGCGRHAYYAAKWAKEIIAVDISCAIDVALNNTKEHNNIHFIQADICALPFPKKSFDFIYSIGVLHHLPDPETGFKKLVELLRDKAGILTYLYHDFPKNDFNYYGLRLVDFPRIITTKMPHGLLYFLCFPIAAFYYLLLVLPYKFLRAMKMGHIDWPFKAYADYPFRVLVNDAFDRYATATANRYLREDVLGWYQRAGLQKVNIKRGWRTFGTAN